MQAEPPTYALQAVACNEGDAGSHWLGTFAVYLTTSRGLVSLA
ncbi:MAG: hypothetical protein WBA39_13835 [Rivularia sp. (in: cyanobacteria)]